MIYINLNRGFFMDIIGVKITDELFEEYKDYGFSTIEELGEYIISNIYMSPNKVFELDGKEFDANLLVFTVSLKGYLERVAWESTLERYNRIRELINQLRKSIQDGGSPISGVPPCDFCKLFHCNPPAAALKYLECPVVPLIKKCSSEESLWYMLSDALYNAYLLCEALLCTIEQQVTQDEREIHELEVKKKYNMGMYYHNIKEKGQNP